MSTMGVNGFVCCPLQDRTHDGRIYRTLNIIVEFTKEALMIRVDRKLNSTDVLDALTDLFILRGPPERAQLRTKAEAAGLPASTLLREALGLTDARRRKPIPRVDPALVLAVGRIGGNLNQIARWLNHAMKVGRTDLDTLTVARRLRFCAATPSAPRL